MTTAQPSPACSRLVTRAVLAQRFLRRLAPLLGLAVATLCALAALGPTRAAAQDQPFKLTLDWTTTSSGSTSSIAWGDVDNDGDLDLAVTEWAENAVYRNDNGVITPVPIWRSQDNRWASTLAWGDYDNDGDLDLVIGGGGTPESTLAPPQPVKLYRNDNGVLSPRATWATQEAYYAPTVNWADYNGDGLLDLAIGGSGADRNAGALALYRNQGSSFGAHPDWTTTATAYVTYIAWADVDGDGDQDLAASLRQQGILLYRNVGGAQAFALAWHSNERADFRSLAFGDATGDGLPELAAGSWYSPARVYRNNAGSLVLDAVWTPPATTTCRVAWADADGDGDLDLTLGNFQEPSLIYRNQFGLLPGNALFANAAAWSSNLADGVCGLAWGDMDNDADLDLALGTFGTSRVFRNGQTLLPALPNTQGAAFADGANVRSVAWGDVDNDGDLDLALGIRYAPTQLLRNADGVLQRAPAWLSSGRADTRSVAWGDVNGDGWLDLAEGNAEGPARVFLNTGGTLGATPTWAAQQTQVTTAVAWGDVDGDGDLDLAVGNGGDLDQPPGSPGGLLQIYANADGQLSAAPTWQAQAPSATSSLAWGDLDQDGDLDLAVGNLHQPVQLYRNTGGRLALAAQWAAGVIDTSFSVRWADSDGDGDLDLSVTNTQPNRIYANQGGTLEPLASWNSIDPVQTWDAAWSDYDGDGDLDLATGTDVLQPARLYLNASGKVSALAAWQSAAPYGEASQSLAWGDVDGDGDLDLATGNYNNANLYLNSRSVLLNGGIAPAVTLALPSPLGKANYHASAATWTAGVLPVTFTLFQRQSRPAQRVVGYYSLDGGGKWFPATPTADTVTANLASAPYPAATVASTHVYTWDVAASGVMGQSDNVVFRLVVIPAVKTPSNDVPGPFLHGATAATTYPFRLRGTQVRVVDPNGAPVPGATVYRVSAGGATGGALLTDAAGVPFSTDNLGYLQGRGTVGAGDRLLALAPLTTTERYTLYATNGAPSPLGVDDFTVAQYGVQTVTVSSGHPLLLLNLTTSLEWDAASDLAFTARLNQDLHKASASLFDWTNGQVALGAVTVYHARQHWDDADVRIYASNQVRPTANRGGIVADTTVLTGSPQLALSEPITVTRGEIRLGAEWNRYGDPQPIADDWPRVLAHELGHFALFLDDTYLGLQPGSGVLVPVTTCARSAMADPYDDSSSEFRYDDGAWQADCGASLAEGPEWSLIRLAWPLLNAPPPTNDGPASVPYAFTHVTFHPSPADPAALLADTNVALEANAAPLAAGRAYLRRGPNQLIDLGRAGATSVLARGARNGDQLCVFAVAQFGCATLTNGLPPIFAVYPLWQPELTLTPVSTTTLRLRLDHAGPGPFLATVFPNNVAPTTVALQPGVEQTVQLAEPAVEAAVVVAGPDPTQRLITTYTTGAGPGRARSYDGPGRARSYDGPFSNGDGRVILFPPLTLPADVFIVVQTATALPTPPPGRVAIGRAYTVRTSAATADFTGASLAIQYFGMDVLLAGQPEANLKLYRYDAGSWSPLPTVLNQAQNIASAPMPGPGLYALLSGEELPLCCAGWNRLSYPIHATRPVTTALAAIDGAYTAVYHYRPDDAADPWKVYAPNVPPWVNDLQVLEFGAVYDIFATQPITLYLDQPPVESAIADSAGSGMPPPPATYYGTVLANTMFTPTVGMPVVATVDGQPCGQATTQFNTQTSAGSIVYAIDVFAADGRTNPACGATGRTVTFTVGGTLMDTSTAWYTDGVVALDLAPQSPPDPPDPPGPAGYHNYVYLPALLKAAP